MAKTAWNYLLLELKLPLLTDSDFGEIMDTVVDTSSE